ncbi:hypothetical protein MNBD_GAMMA15-2141 [hydrothermal vent metagenome]|uniref:Lipoprotein n=1 Tax=hydrothermal vent metagenome TaxID=652676 RepID=A0A3B0YQ85_9ZZZZ
MLKIKKWLFIGALLGSIVGCWFAGDSNNYLEVESDRTELALGLLSYSNFSEIKAVLNLDNSKVIVLDEGNQSEDSSKRPPFNIHTIKVKDLEIDGYVGDLELSFFNDRLMYTRFYASDFEGYISNLQLGRTQLESRDGILIKPYTHVWIYTNHQNIRYIGWRDTRLSKQFNEWIKRYS